MGSRGEGGADAGLGDGELSTQQRSERDVDLGSIAGYEILVPKPTAQRPANPRGMVRNYAGYSGSCHPSRPQRPGSGLPTSSGREAGFIPNATDGVRLSGLVSGLCELFVFYLYPRYKQLGS